VFVSYSVHIFTRLKSKNCLGIPRSSSGCAVEYRQSAFEEKKPFYFQNLILQKSTAIYPSLSILKSLNLAQYRKLWNNID
jgi:hypothetical protein